MDKYEYRVRAEEIKALLANREYAQAMRVADTIDWQRVKSISMLCTVSEIYKINREYEKSRDILLLAYERYPNGRMIVYALCELSVKMEEYVQAIEYYKEFVKIAPRDTGRYILQYKIYEAQDVGLEERIQVLEEFKKRDYREKWAYELAYLYHRIGLATKCVEECDELVLWFGEGKYVVKAMELKMLHAALTPAQQEKYARLTAGRRAYRGNPERTVEGAMDGEEDYPDAADENGGYEGEEAREGGYIQDDSRYEASYDLEEGYAEQENFENAGGYEQGKKNRRDDPYRINDPYETDEETGNDVSYGAGDQGPDSDGDDDDIRVKPVNLGRYNTINLQEELAKSMREVLGMEDKTRREPSENEVYGQDGSTEDEVYGADDSAEDEDYGEGGNTEDEIHGGDGDPEEEGFGEDGSTEDEIHGGGGSAGERGYKRPQRSERRKPTDEIFDSLLTEEYDGQIGLYIENEEDKLEKQITGQLDFSDILAEWEKIKQENDKKRMEEAKKRSLRQTNDIMSQLVGVIPGLAPMEFKPSDFAGDVPEAAAAPENLQAGGLAADPESGVSARGTESENDFGQEYLEEFPEEEEAEEAEYPDGEYTGEGEAGYPGEEYPDDEEAGYPDEEYPDDEEAGYPDEEYPDDDEAGYPDEEYPDDEEIEYSDEEYPDDEEVEYSGEEYPDDDEAGYPDEEYPDDEEVEYSDEEYPDDEEIEYSGEEYPDDDEAGYPDGEYPDDEEVEYSDEEYPEEDDEEAEYPDEGSPDGEDASEEEQRGRDFSDEEYEFLAPYAEMEGVRGQLLDALDEADMEAVRGNIIVTGSQGSGRTTLAVDVIKTIQATRRDFKGKVAKISATALNKKDVNVILKQLKNGALVIEHAGSLKEPTAEKLMKGLSRYEGKLLLVLEDSRNSIEKLIKAAPDITKYFTARIDIPEYSNDDLVAYGRAYALEQDYAIDEMGVLALYTRIADMQTLDHSVTVAEVRDIVDAAVKHVCRKTPGHFMDILFAKRYDREDYIILRERDFITK